MRVFQTVVDEGGFAAAVGAFLVTGALIVLTGLIRPLGRWITAIPRSLASAMLAGILFDLCVAPVRALAGMPLQAGLIIATFVLVGLWRRIAAVPIAALVTILLVVLGPGAASLPGAADIAGAVFTMPQFHLSAIIGIALPLYVITMASQNVPGLAIIKLNGYDPAPGPIFVTTGAATMMTAPFGGCAINLAAITAALDAEIDAL